MELKHYKLRWPDRTIPLGEPEWMLYEVDDLSDRVLRMVEIFEDGTSHRNSLALENQKGPAINSLVSMNFAEGIADVSYELVSAELFGELYAAAPDRTD